MFSTRPDFALVAAAATITCIAPPAVAWNAHGHRTVTLLALDRLPTDTPDWLRDPHIRARIADQANEPDRWRGTKLVPIGHEANPEHYINLEALDTFGTSLRQLPRHRYEAFREWAIAKERNPGRFAPVGRDADKSKEWPGFLPWAIQEHHAKLQSAFSTYRILSEINDPARARQLEQARQNIIYHMGVLSHYVGDAAQPLHVTVHHHGWVGENPQGYSTAFGIHSYIDGTILQIHRLNYDVLRPLMPTRAEVVSTAAQPADAWELALGVIERSFAEVERLYIMEKDGSIRGDAGKAFISERLCDAGVTLGDLYASAWHGATPTQNEITAFIKFSEMRTPRSRQQAPRELEEIEVDNESAAEPVLTP